MDKLCSSHMLEHYTKNRNELYTIYTTSETWYCMKEVRPQSVYYMIPFVQSTEIIQN